MNQIVEKLQFPDMVVKRCLPIPSNIMNYQWQPGTIKVLEKVGGLNAQEKIVNVNEFNGPAHSVF
jgi:hypothetical protein